VPSYAKFARFYDRVNGDRAADVEHVRDCIRRFHPDARSLLELGCGTGAILSGLASEMAVTGVDQSPEMLAMAAQNLPGAQLVESDMTKLALDARFDVAICVFDTLNHLPRFEMWQETFDRVHEHLADDGIFIFDVNTTGRLRRLWHGFAFAEDFGQNTVIMDVTPGGGDLSLWEVRIFEALGDEMFRQHREVILELGVPLEDIRAALAGNFDELEAADLDDGPVTDDSARVFFVWRRKPSALVTAR
jgi:SAM-dependent methyltransferase